MRLLKTAFLLLLASILAAQTAQFPTSVVTDTQLKVARNRAVTTLATGISAAATSFTVASGAVFTKPALVTIDDEIIAVCDIVGNTLSVGESSCPNVDGRGFDGTSAAAHNSAALVYGYIAAWHHNAITAELKAIETALGAGFSLPLAVPKGGMGTAGTYTVNGVLLGNGTGNVQATAAGTADQVFVIPTAGGPPQFGTAQIAGGGTGATTAAGARTNLGVSASGANSDITQLLGLGLTGLVTGAGGSGLSAVAAANQLDMLERTPNVAGVQYRFAAPTEIFSTKYDFPRQAPAENLSPTLKTATLTPCPLGVSGADTGHNLGIYNNAGTWQESVLINGGTCTSGLATGTITFATVVGTYASGAYKIGSAFNGVPEAVYTAVALGIRKVKLPASDLHAYAEAYVAPGVGLEIEGSYPGTQITLHATTGYLFNVSGGSWFQIGGFFAQHASSLGATAGAFIRIDGTAYAKVHDVFTYYGWNILELQHVYLCQINSLYSQSFLNHGIHVTGTTSHTGIQADGVQFGGSGTSSGLIGLYVSAKFQSSEFLNFVTVNMDYGVYVDIPSGGYFNESHFNNFTIDSSVIWGVVLTGSVGGTTGGVLRFSNGRVSSAINNTAGGITINSKYSDIGISNVSMVNPTYSVLLQGVKKVSIEGNAMDGLAASGVATGIALANDGAAVCDNIHIANNMIGHDTSWPMVTGLSVSAHAHTNLHIAHNRIRGSSTDLAYSGTGAGNLFFENDILTGKPTCAAGLRGSTWYTASAAGTADLNQTCEKNANNAYAWAGRTTYALHVQHLTYDPADAGTVYWGELPKAPVAAAATSKIYIRKAGTIKVAEIYTYAATAGTNEAWSLYLRLNNSTDTLIATVSAATQERVFSNTALGIAVAVGDYIEIKGVQPTWVTNPLGVIGAGYLYVE